jgi:hypothetical protein
MSLHAHHYCRKMVVTGQATVIYEGVCFSYGLRY